MDTNIEYSSILIYFDMARIDAMKTNRVQSLFPFAAVAFLASCSASHHPVVPAELGTPAVEADLLAVLNEPGPIAFEAVRAARWAVPRSGLINLEHPTAQAAGLEDGDEPIEIYFYALRHPRYGVFLVDSGVSAEFTSDDGSDRIGFLVRQFMNTETLAVETTTRDWLAQQDEPLAGVFLTHIHIDHVLGLADIPDGTPVFVGPGETGAASFLNLFSRGTTDALLSPAGPLQEWAFQNEPGETFAGIIDVFGDGSVFALHVPGHSPGSTAFVVRTPTGPKLLVGDASHTAWGWQHGVEPGSFSLDGPQSAESLAGLRELAAKHPMLEVHLGHQRLHATTASLLDGSPSRLVP